MGSFAGIAIGVLIGVVTSIYPIYHINLFFCVGLLAGGYVAVRIAGGRGGQIESVQGLRIGLWVGVLVALVVFAINLIVQGGVSVPTGGVDSPPVSILDPIPPVFTAFLERFVAGFRNLVSGGFYVQQPGVTLGERLAYGLVMLPFFSAIGGIMAASMYRRQPPVTPDRAQEVPISPY
ncbi:MAG: hypothetical protein LCH53_03645 [Bacteroidetes bacterium]|nr:hypothetical protein [Bacteroidota bacterium]